MDINIMLLPPHNSPIWRSFSKKGFITLIPFAHFVHFPKMKALPVFTFLAAALFAFQVNALKVLFVAPLFKNNITHHNFCMHIGKALTDKEHEVHFLVPILEDSIKRPDGRYGRLKVRYYTPQNAQLREELLHKGSMQFHEIYAEMAEDPAFMAELCAQNYDVAITEATIFTIYAFPLFYWLDIPKTMAVNSYSLEPNMLHILGLAERALQMTIPPVYYGQSNTKLGDHDDVFRQSKGRKAEIAAAYQTAIVGNVEGRARIVRTASVYTAKHFPENSPFPGLFELLGRASALLVNSQPELEFTDQFAELLENDSRVKFIGGIHMRQGNKGGESTLNTQKGGKEQSETEKLLEKADQKEAIVMISFGTFFDSGTGLGETNFNAIRATIKAMPNRFFFWQLNKGDERIEQLRNDPELVDNLHVADWLQIPAILGHMRATPGKQHVFVSHCGRNSNLEAIVHGVPLVCIPIHGDQFYNTEALVRKHYAVALNLLDRSEEPPKDALTQEALSKAIGHKFDLQKVDELSAKISARVQAVAEVISRTMEEIGAN